VSIKSTALLLAFALAIPYKVYGQSLSSRDQSLQGLPGVIVEVGLFSNDRVPTPDTLGLRTLIELELRRAGIPVLTYRWDLNPRQLVSWGLLSYKLVLVPGGGGVAITGVLPLSQSAIIPRTGRPVSAQTWSARDVTAWSPSGAALDAEIKAGLQLQIAEFLNAYLAANQRR
jgi:hypothetical protein